MDAITDEITRKYANNTTPEHVMALESIPFARQLLSPYRETFAELITGEQYMHSIGSFYDLTLYRDMLYSKSFALQLRMVKAALMFLNEIDAVASELD
jgi:hypothetical protein